MKTVLIERYGDNGVVQLTDVDPPTPRADQVRLKVCAAGVNPIDWKIRSGAGGRVGLSLPIHLGREISGIVDAVGEGTDRFAVGDAVFGVVGSGGFAEHAVAQAADFVRIPRGLGFVDAAAVPLGALTAWQALFDHAKLATGQRLLVTNSSGGVGSLAVQLAKAKGAYVVAMTSPRNEDYVRSLGVDEVVDYTAQPFERVVRDVDVVFDTVGGDTFERAFHTLKRGGFLVTAVAFPKSEGEPHGVEVARVQCKPSGEQLTAIAELVDEGKLRAHVSMVMPLAEVRRALELSEAGRTRGKIVLRIAD